MGSLPSQHFSGGQLLKEKKERIPTSLSPIHTWSLCPRRLRQPSAFPHPPVAFGHVLAATLDPPSPPLRRDCWLAADAAVAAVVVTASFSMADEWVVVDVVVAAAAVVDVVVVVVVVAVVVVV